MSTIRGTVLKEIVWGPQGQNYKAGDPIEGDYRDMSILESQRVVAIMRDDPVEVATVRAPEQAVTRTRIPTGRGK
jgi:hypothetical protein